MAEIRPASEKTGFQNARYGPIWCGSDGFIVPICRASASLSGAGICRNRAAFELVVQGSGVLCELAQFEPLADLEVIPITSTVSQVKTLAVITVDPIVGGDMR